MSNPSVGDKARYAAERVMEPILRRWFEIDLEPVDLDSNAENAAVDLSWALESAGLLLPIELVVPEERAPTQTKVERCGVNCPDHGEVDGDTCWDCPISPYGKVGPLTTCCGHRKDAHYGDGCQAAVTFGDPPQGAGRCACRYMGEAENQEAWPRPTTVDRVDPDDRAHVEKVRGWVQELARMHVEDGEELPTRLALVQPPMNDTVAVREDAENRRDPDVVAICDELDALRITEVKLRDALARAAAAPVDDRERVPEGWRVEWLVEEPEGPGCGPRRIPYLDQIPAVSPSVDPEKEP